jgi:ribosomal protein S18 acetylase RimI-like enzyme
MNEVIYSKITNPEEIEILSGKTFQYNDLILSYSQKTIDLLKKNFNLKDSLYIIAKQSNEFVGFCSIDKDWWEDGFFMIREIFINPNLQKQGVGEKIMGMCIEHARNKKAVGVVTETDFRNIPMQGLCKKFNFKEMDNPHWKDGITYKLLF